MKMFKKKTINRLQNLALVLLTVSALLLVARLPVVRSGWTARLHTLLAGTPQEDREMLRTDLEGLLPSLHVVVTADEEYGRMGRLYVPLEDPVLQELLPLFQEAIGSAGESYAVADQTLQSSLSGPSLYLEMPAALPQSVAAAWLGESSSEERTIRALALSGEEETAVLYFLGGDGSLFRSPTALPATAVRQAVEGAIPNGCRFAFETNYGPLSPYTVLTSSMPPVEEMTAETPAGYSAFNLLSALDFNPHTIFRYTENSGVEVVEDSPRALRIAPDGTVEYGGVSEEATPLYRVSGSGEVQAAQAVEAAGRIAAALTEGTGASPLVLQSVEEQEEGWTVTFSYQTQGFPVHFSDRGYALEVIIRERAVVEFRYRCRLYTSTGEEADLLPPEMAVAIASLRPGAGLSVGYVDRGTETLEADWLTI